MITTEEKFDESLHLGRNDQSNNDITKGSGRKSSHSPSNFTLTLNELQSLIKETSSKNHQRTSEKFASAAVEREIKLAVKRVRAGESSPLARQMRDRNDDFERLHPKSRAFVI